MYITSQLCYDLQNCVQMNYTFSIDLSKPPLTVVKCSLWTGNGWDSAAVSQVIHQERPRSVTLARTSKQTLVGRRTCTHHRACTAREVGTTAYSICVCV